MLHGRRAINALVYADDLVLKGPTLKKYKNLNITVKYGLEFGVSYNPDKSLFYVILIILTFIQILIYFKLM